MSEFQESKSINSTKLSDINQQVHMPKYLKSNQKWTKKYLKGAFSYTLLHIGKVTVTTY